ncbi:MAG: hypothetical protein R3330_16040, partial [Saprospiraceae bacterium]|nr:hypothetical protein [Saprospiraceae bacterium]
GGLPPYDITLTVSLSIFPDLTLPGIAIDANESINICVQGLFPSFDSGTNTVFIPELLAGLSGTVTLVSMVDGLGCPGTIVAPGSLSLTILPEATANAGSDITICAGSTATVNGNVGGSASGGTWSSNGDGMFADPTSLNTTYMPGPGDESAGTVILTLTSDDVGGACTAAISSLMLTILPPPTASADPVGDICGMQPVTVTGIAGGSGGTWIWSTTGDGSFTDPGALSTEYLPGPGDLQNGNVTLTFTVSTVGGNCPVAEATVVVTLLQPPTADTGPDLTICSDQAAALAVNLGGTATSGVWTSSGDGSFDDPTGLMPVYTPGPGDITNGSVLLTFITDDTGGLCTPDTSTVNLTINPAIMITDIPDITACNSAVIEVSAMASGSFTGLEWSTSGDGTFDNIQDALTFYHPGQMDT